MGEYTQEIDFNMLRTRFRHEIKGDRIKQGKLHLRVGDSAFEQAMNQVLGRLREAVPAQQAG